MKKILFGLLLLTMSLGAYCSEGGVPENGVVFGRIYTGFYASLSSDSPMSGFDFTTGILGYRHNLSDKVNAILIYDVTRTTNIMELYDTSGDTVVLNYFEGSKYTAFLKMAQINWKITPKLELSVGQLLNQQYLTLQDKWWGLRYVRVTFQEAFRYGMPADFGARVTLSPTKDLKISLSAVNGEGPFRYQDNNSKYLLSTNIEYSPIKNALLKVYADIEQPSSELNGEQTKNVISAFAGYKAEKLMIGAEWNYIQNHKFIDENVFSGISVYSSYRFKEKFMVFGRLDFGDLVATAEGYYGIIGLEYQPEKNYNISVNYRHIKYFPDSDVLPTLNINFGIKF